MGAELGYIILLSIELFLEGAMNIPVYEVIECEVIEITLE